jgi:hypothetical protein
MGCPTFSVAGVIFRVIMVFLQFCTEQRTDNETIALKRHAHEYADITVFVINRSTADVQMVMKMYRHIMSFK